MVTQMELGRPSSARPTGTVTFLFSDIEGSTVRWEQHRDAMAAALERHDALMRGTLEAQGAYVFKTVGDAFCAAFASAQEATVAALAAQRALAAEDFSAVDGLRVRMALHSGNADERDGDYFGPTVNRVARLLAIGHGGQVLISRTCAELLHGEMPPHCELRDLGAHRLKDLAHPEQVHQLVAPDLPDAFSELRSLGNLSNNLPAQLTSFIGREEVVTEIKRLIDRHRLVTLVGAGGAGKTRCAIQVGAELLDGSGDGVWLAELAPISDPKLVANVIVQALNVQAPHNRPVLDTALAYLKRKRLLLILDNCEHVVDEARAVVAAILHACPDVRILATSREHLNIAGEQTYRMPSLSVPLAGQAFATHEISSFGALALFADRAVSVESRFSITLENALHVADICRRLDGIPLAIELAAARVKVLSPQQLARKLDERFRILTGGDRSALPRHQTMRALIDWSYDLLRREERALFCKLSIFAGGFTLESAVALRSDAALDELAVLDLLSSLVDKSLVQADSIEGSKRYRLLETTRQYAREKLRESGEYESAARAHGAAFLAFAHELVDCYELTPDRVWDARAEPEMENFRAALTWALIEHGDVQLGQRLAAALRPAFMHVAPAEGRRWVHAAQEKIDAQTPAAVIAALDFAEAQLAAVLSQHKAAYAAASRALTRYRELDDARQIALLRLQAGSSLVFTGDIAAGEALLAEALDGARALGARRLIGSVLRSIAIARQFAGDPLGARKIYGDSLAIARSIGAERLAAVIAVSLAEAEFFSGDAAAALRLGREGLEAYRAFNDLRSAANTLSNLAAYLVALERYDEARQSAREGLADARDAQFDVYIAFTLQHLAAVGALRQPSPAAIHEDGARAARLLGYVDARLAALEALREYTEQQEYDAMLPALRVVLGEDGLSKLMNEGSIWSEDQAVAEAMLI
jgi:predicted ATPase/class 3 adenylate cyclase/Arc/MetJ family transcription regulator